MAAANRLTATALLADFPPPVAELTDALRAVLSELAPSLEERVYPGWRALGYRHRRAGYVCGLFPQLGGQVKLSFEQGAALSDPEHALVGDGRQVRYLVFEPGGAVDPARIAPFLLEAIAFGERRRGSGR